AWMRLRDSNSQVGYLQAILAGTALPAEPPAGDPYVCPFVRVESFLTDEEHACLLDMISRPGASTMPSTVGDGDYEPEIRRSKLVPREETRDVKRWFAPKLRSLLPEILPRLLPDAMEAGRIELQMTVHNDGDGYIVHTDDHEADEQPRRVSYVYYFH